MKYRTIYADPPWPEYGGGKIKRGAVRLLAAASRAENRKGENKAMIYETRGRAREYFELAANLYIGCEHACVYCYGADVLHKPEKEFFSQGRPRKDALREIERDAARLRRKYETRHILLSFVTDPYQPAEMKEKLTRNAIQILHRYGLAVAILTKGGVRATRDFDILRPADIFGTTLTFVDASRSRSWEPGAGSPAERIASVESAHKLGIQTWVSLEPVIDPMETLQLIEMTAPFVDVFKVGTLNYANKLPREFTPPRVEWKTFARNVIILLDKLNANYYIKRDLARHIGQDAGISKGKIPK